MQLHQPRLAEMVASILRDRILAGTLNDGDALPRQEDLLQEFQISKPSLREALRILEAEGLITVRRGNRGGALIHVPKPSTAAYTIGLVLQHRNVSYEDVGQALKGIEPICAGLCASREDRATEVLPHLRKVHEAVCDAVDDEVDFTRLARTFHEEIVQRCGNQTLILVVGALESLWSMREEVWAEWATEHGEFPDAKRRKSGLKAHERIIELIEQGEVERLQRHARQHLENSLFFTLTTSRDQVVEAASIQNGLYTGARPSL